MGGIIPPPRAFVVGGSAPLMNQRVVSILKNEGATLQRTNAW
jgi:hypothetical protein